MTESLVCERTLITLFISLITRVITRAITRLSTGALLATVRTGTSEPTIRAGALHAESLACSC